MSETAASAITVATVCATCAWPIYSIPELADKAYCLNCARDNAGITWGVWDKVGHWSPGVDYTVRDFSYVPDAVVREPFPMPAVTTREHAVWLLPPTPALKLAEFAREYSWDVRMQRSQGNMPHATTGRPGALKDVIALRFGAHPMTDRQAYAVYSRPARPSGNWAWSSVMVWGPDLPPYGGCGIEHLKEFLREPDRPTGNMLVWVGVIKHCRAQQAAKSKARPKAPAKPKEVG